VSTAFGQQVGQGWEQVGLLAVAFVLSLAIGTEREARQKSAGVRTYTVVGVGAALFVLLSKYGFTDVLGGDVRLDPSRVAAQIVTGVGFIGGGLIFVRRDSVHGLTTAASVWLTAAIGAAAGGGLVVLAAVTAGLYFVTVYALRPLAVWVQGRHAGSFGLRISYLDGYGVIREVINRVTEHGFAVTDLTTLRGGSPALAEESGRDDRRDRDLPAAPEHAAHTEVTLLLSGPGDRAALTAALSELDHVLGVRTVSGDADA
jgi:putative Mg2+ transporter-C (MgtC) family protein